MRSTSCITSRSAPTRSCDFLASVIKRRLVMQKNLRDFLNFMRFIVMRFHQDRCIQIAASLTFTTLLSLVPLLTIALTVFSAFPVFEDFSSQIKTYLINNLMPDMAGKIITQYMRQFTESAMRLTAGGVELLAVTGMLQK